MNKWLSIYNEATKLESYEELRRARYLGQERMTCLAWKLVICLVLLSSLDKKEIRLDQSPDLQAV